jgi:hypothetical protein
MILKSEYFSRTPLRHDIEVLASNGEPTNAIRLANIVAKYVLSLIWESVDRIVPYEAYKETTMDMVRVMWSRSPWDSDSIIKSLRYQLEMILDIPATIEVLEEVIDTIENRNREKKEQYVWLDLWSWSAILMAGQYIWARRRWVKKPKIQGIEFEWLPQLFASSLIGKLWIGTITLDNVKDPKSYPKEIPDGITMELLPTTWGPFLHFRPQFLWWGEDYEPFLESLELLRSLYGRNSFEQFSMFPRWLEIGSIHNSQRVSGTSDEMFWWELTDETNITRDTAASYYPLRILFKQGWRRLDEVGNSESLKELFEQRKDLRRWSHLSPQVLDSIYRNQRARLNRIVAEEE